MSTTILSDAITAYLHSTAFRVICGFVLFAGAGIWGALWFEVPTEKRSSVRTIAAQVLLPGFVGLGLILCLISAVALGMFFYPDARSRHTDQAAWESLKELGTSGIQQYLVQHPEGENALPAMRYLAEKELHTVVSVEQEYNGVAGFSLPVEIDVTRLALTNRLRGVYINVRLTGSPLSQNYQRRGVLFTGAALTGSLSIQDAASSEVVFNEDFDFRTEPLPSVSLRETDPGPHKPSEAPFAAVYAELLSFVDKATKNTVRNRPSITSGQ